MANKLKGEVDWQVEEKTYTLRLSLDDLLALENELGIPTLKWQQRIGDRELGVKEVNQIIIRGLRRVDPGKFQGTGSQDKIKTIMEAAGFLSCVSIAVDVLLEALRDPVERKKRHQEELDGKDPDAETPLP